MVRNFILQQKGAALKTQLIKNIVFYKLAEGKEVPKTSNATPKCMWILEKGAPGSKPKRLAKQGILENIA